MKAYLIPQSTIETFEKTGDQWIVWNIIALARLYPIDHSKIFQNLLFRTLFYTSQKLGSIGVWVGALPFSPFSLLAQVRLSPAVGVCSAHRCFCCLLAKYLSHNVQQGELPLSKCNYDLPHRRNKQNIIPSISKQSVLLGVHVSSSKPQMFFQTSRAGSRQLVCRWLFNRISRCHAKQMFTSFRFEIKYLLSPFFRAHRRKKKCFLSVKITLFLFLCGVICSVHAVQCRF